MHKLFGFGAISRMLLLIVLTVCWFTQTANAASAPPDETRAELLFQDVTEAVGLPITAGGLWGISWFDADQDGLLDVALNGHRNAPQFFSYVGAQTFVDVTYRFQGNISWEEDRHNLVYGDYVHNGFPDFYIIHGGEGLTGDKRNELLVYDEIDDVYFDVAEDLGLLYPLGKGRGVVLFDYNGDQVTDLYLINEHAPGSSPSSAYLGDLEGGFTPDPDNGLGISSRVWGGTLLCDYDNDGDTDVFLTNRLTLMLLKNNGGVFTDVAVDAGLADTTYHTSGAVADFDNDGWVDIVVTHNIGTSREEPSPPDDLSGAPSKRGSCSCCAGRHSSYPQQFTFYRNRGDGTFEVVANTGLDATGAFGEMGWADFDNDGFVDLYVGVTELDGESSRNLLYRNLGNPDEPRFEEVAVASGATGTLGVTDRVVSLADYDRDGRVDIFTAVGHMNQTAQRIYLYNNATANSNGFLAIQLQGPVGNVNAIGARVELKSGTMRQYRQHYNGYGSHSQHSPIIHFGIGTKETLSVRITWPNGLRRTYENVEPNTYLGFTQPTAAVLYVDDDATGPERDGSSWCDAFHKLQNALAVAESAEGTVNEIRIAEGVYQPDQGTNQIPGDRDAAFHLLSGVTIRGGYAGCGAIDPDERDIELYETILSGDLNGDDGPGFANYEDNSFHVVTAWGTDNTTNLDGVTISHGHADDGFSRGWHDGAGKGGGIYNSNGHPTISNCTIKLNWADVVGGGIFIGPGSGLTVDNCVFTDNMATQDGGGLFGRDADTYIVTDSVFEHNVAHRGGGGMYVEVTSADVAITNCIFRENMSFYRGGGLRIWMSNVVATNCDFLDNVALRDGGGIHNYGIGSGSVAIVDCRFTGNAADFYGGGLGNQEGEPTLMNCTFTDNSAGFDGGGIYSHDGSFVLEGCSFTTNTAADLGGALANESIEARLTGCAFISNHARIAGAVGNEEDADSTLIGCAFTGNTSETLGGAMYNVYNSVTLTDCALTGNVAEDNGGAIYNIEVVSGIEDCTIAGNSAGFDGGGVCNVSSQMNAKRCFFGDNAALDGGGMFNYAHGYFGGVTIEQCTFLGNTAAGDGGAVYNTFAPGYTITNTLFSGNHAGQHGGAMHNTEISTPMLRGCTISANTAAFDGGGIYSSTTSRPRVSNSIFWGNSDAGGADESAQLHVESLAPIVIYSIVQGWTGQHGGEGNSDENPLFADAAGSDSVPGTEDDNLRLLFGSPAINGGNLSFVPGVDETDLDGHARVLCGRVDMGAYESGAGDFNCDGLIDLGDFVAWADCMTGPSGGPIEADCQAFDYDGDMDVDMNDFAVFQFMFPAP